eukprot:4554890-Pleurochrysis_carterae.AAC.1
MTHAATMHAVLTNVSVTNVSMMIIAATTGATIAATTAPTAVTTAATATTTTGAATMTTAATTAAIYDYLDGWRRNDRRRDDRRREECRHDDHRNERDERCNNSRGSHDSGRDALSWQSQSRERWSQYARSPTPKHVRMGARIAEIEASRAHRSRAEQHSEE